MTREDFINWLDRPLTDTDNKIIDTLVTMIESYDKNMNEKIFLLEKIDKIQKIINDKKYEEIEVLDVD